MKLEAEEMVRALGTLFAALAGLAFGSSLNVCLSRWPEGESVVKPRSHCRSCARTLAWWENVPLVSWIALRGRCRTCGVWIGWRFPLVELAVGGLWAAVGWHLFREPLIFDMPFASICDDLLLAGAWMLFYWLVVALAILDAENLWLPDRITIPGAAIGFLFSPAHELLNAFTPERHSEQTALHAAGWACLSNLLNMALAAGLILIIRWIYWLFRRREGIGLGDAKLMAMLAAWLGLSGALLSFGLGVTLGALVALILLIVRSTANPPADEPQKWALTKLPLGTFLCVGGIISGLWGQRIIDVYLRWAGF